MSESEQEDRPRIKVTDRRLFDREGNVREPAEEPATTGDAASESGAREDRVPPGNEVPTASPGEDRAVPPRPDSSTAAGGPASAPRAETTGATPGAAAGEPRRVSEDRLRAAMEADRDDRSELDPGPQSAADLPRDFASFVESQYYETLLFLGAMRHPATGQTVEDLDMARYKIDLLSMLQEKTEGNRTPEESQLLEDVLYQLRMGYLQKRKVPKL